MYATPPPRNYGNKALNLLKEMRCQIDPTQGDG